MLGWVIVFFLASVVLSGVAYQISNRDAFSAVKIFIVSFLALLLTVGLSLVEQVEQVDFLVSEGFSARIGFWGCEFVDSPFSCFEVLDFVRDDSLRRFVNSSLIVGGDV